jgi:hypothetical protein
MDLPVELVGLLKQAGIAGEKFIFNGFIPFRLPLADALSISFPGGRREVFLLLGLAGNFPCFVNGFLSQTHN